MALCLGQLASAARGAWAPSGGPVRQQVGPAPAAPRPPAESQPAAQSTLFGRRYPSHVILAVSTLLFLGSFVRSFIHSESVESIRSAAGPVLSAGETGVTDGGRVLAPRQCART